MSPSVGAGPRSRGLPGFLEVDLGPGARGGFTTRAGGVSTGPYAAAEGGGLNLGPHVGDDPAAVRENRERLRGALGVEPVWMRQVHGARVRVVTGPDEARTEPPEGDAVLAPPGTGVAPAVMVADCIPLLLAHCSGAVAAAHVGRGGLVAGVVEAVVAGLEEVGAAPDGLVAVVGPSVCGRCYEVPDRMRADVAAQVPAAWATTSWGTPSLDLPGGVAARLAQLGVGEVRQVGLCTVEDERFYSYRRAGTGGAQPATGRFAGVVAQRADTPTEKPPARRPLV